MATERIETPESLSTATSSILDRHVQSGDSLGNFDPLNDVKGTTEKDDPLIDQRRGHMGVVTVLSDYRKREAELKKDPRAAKYGPEWVKDQLKEEAHLYEERVGYYVPLLEAAKPKAAKAEKDLLASVLPDIAKETPAQAVRHAEIRTWFAKLDRSTHLKVIQDALADEEGAETLAAILSTPKSMRVLPEQIHQHLFARLLETKNPEGVAELARMQRHIAILEFAITRCKELLRPTSEMSMRERLQGKP